MKRFALLICLFALILSLTSCIFLSRQDKVLKSIGNYDSKQFWTHGAFQDYTDFGVYSYSSANLDDNKYFARILESDIETICAFIDNFERLVESIGHSDPNAELALNYSFDRSIIDSEDYFYIYEDESYPKFGCYDVYFFDTQTKMLYYFHDNI